MSRPTNDEIKCLYHKLFNGDNESSQNELIDTVNWAIDKALEGMIPADKSILIPDEKDWDIDATQIEIVFSTKGNSRYRAIEIIPRSKPKYQPKVGDKVFWKDTYVIYQIGFVGSVLVTLIGVGDAHIGEIKPATLELMGKPWDEVPNE